MRCVATRKIGPARRKCGAPRQAVLEPFVGFVTAVGQQAVIAHADPQHARHDIQDQRGEDRTGINEKEGRTAPR